MHNDSNTSSITLPTWILTFGEPSAADIGPEGTFRLTMKFLRFFNYCTAYWSCLLPLIWNKRSDVCATRFMPVTMGTASAHTRRMIWRRSSTTAKTPTSSTTWILKNSRTCTKICVRLLASGRPGLLSTRYVLFVVAHHLLMSSTTSRILPLLS